ncbi:hypothetical protein DFH08DRAFT_812238 [Mycena albidolilacea]|uniref:non-specific serine/threonine protein kinase n=1 Tax=Mycena albidolilacea TaxID=1033008 RepID=A0AAD6ZU73_9AGAR|nr:hypothetical protein DFH08DRAFT_812238 [Mycena albidolilacea]
MFCDSTATPGHRPFAFIDLADAEEYESTRCYPLDGFCPIKLGDVLGDPLRYRVISKMGHAGSSTVWLAWDRVSSGSPESMTKHRERIEKQLPAGVADDPAGLVKILRRMMVLDPAKRPTATELLDNAYFQLSEIENSEIHTESTTPVPASGSATDWRFVFADDDAYETSECYAPGDVLGSPPRYRIISELSVGRSSTVWLARDRVSRSSRALSTSGQECLRQAVEGLAFIDSHGVDTESTCQDLQASSFDISVPEINKYSDIAMWTFNGPGRCRPLLPTSPDLNPHSFPPYLSASVDFAGFIFRRSSEVRERAPTRVAGGSVASELPETLLFYAAPEVVFLRVAPNADAHPSDQRSDIWSLAVTEIENRFASSGVDDPAEIATLIRKMMMVDPARRPMASEFPDDAYFLDGAQDVTKELSESSEFRELCYSLGALAACGTRCLI